MSKGEQALKTSLSLKKKNNILLICWGNRLLSSCLWLVQGLTSLWLRSGKDCGSRQLLWNKPIKSQNHHLGTWWTNKSKMFPHYVNKKSNCRGIMYCAKWLNIHFLGYDNHREPPEHEAIHVKHLGPAVRWWWWQCPISKDQEVCERFDLVSVMPKNACFLIQWRFYEKFWCDDASVNESQTGFLWSEILTLVDLRPLCAETSVYTLWGEKMTFLESKYIQGGRYHTCPLACVKVL